VKRLLFDLALFTSLALIGYVALVSVPWAVVLCLCLAVLYERVERRGQ